MTDTVSKLALTAAAIALVALAFRPSAPTASATDLNGMIQASDPAFQKAVLALVNQHCDVVKRPKGKPQNNLELTCYIPSSGM